jgi:lipopolysaccharide export LptBFGC system permease protein LptF
VIGVMLSLCSLWLNLNVVPFAKASSLQLLYEQAWRDPDSLLKPGVVQGSFGGGGSGIQKVLIEGKNGGWVEGFHFHQLPAGGGAERTYVHAERAALAIDEENRQLRVKLENAYFETRKGNGDVNSALAAKAEPLLIDLKSPKNRRKKASGMSNQEIEDEIKNNKGLTPLKKVQFRAEITKRYSFSMACLSFAFVAIPLGLGARRRESSSGLVVSLLIGTGYFLLTMLAEQFKTDLGATVMLWLPNLLCVILGVILFHRARFK